MSRPYISATSPISYTPITLTKGNNRYSLWSTQPCLIITSLIIFYDLTVSNTEELLYLNDHQSVQSISRTDSLWPHESQHARPPCSSPTPGAYPNSCPWVGDANQPSHTLLSSSPPAPIPPSIRVFFNESLFATGGRSIGVSALASVLPMNTQDWSPLGWTGWTSLQAKRLWRVFSNTTVQKHQFFHTQLSSQSNSHIHTWPMEKP